MKTILILGLMLNVSAFAQSTQREFDQRSKQAFRNEEQRRKSEFQQRLDRQLAGVKAAIQLSSRYDQNREQVIPSSIQCRRNNPIGYFSSTECFYKTDAGSVCSMRAFAPIVRKPDWTRAVAIQYQARCISHQKIVRWFYPEIRE